MKSRIIVIVPILALASYFSGFLFGPTQQPVGTVAGTSAKPTPTPEKDHITDCYTFTVPQGYEAPYGDPAKCEMVTKQPGGQTYISINRQPESDSANYTNAATVRNQTSLPNCSDPDITQPEHGMIKSVFTCVGQTNQYYYFASKGSRLGSLPGVAGKSLFYYVVDGGNNPVLHGDELLARLKPND